MLIRVAGRAEASLTPERGTVTLVVRLEGPVKQDVVNATGAALARTVQLVRSLHDPQSGPVTWFSHNQLVNSAHRPWNKDGKQLPMVYRSSADVKVKFRDFAALHAFIEQISAYDGVMVQGVAWALTEARRVQVQHQIQADAVRDAMDKARRIAEAAGATDVRPVMITDPGLLVAGSTTTHSSTVMAARAAGAAGADQAFVPEDVVVSAAVEAEFTTD